MMHVHLETHTESYSYAKDKEKNIVTELVGWLDTNKIVETFTLYTSP